MAAFYSKFHQKNDCKNLTRKSAHIYSMFLFVEVRQKNADHFLTLERSVKKKKSQLTYASRFCPLSLCSLSLLFFSITSSVVPPSHKASSAYASSARLSQSTPVFSAHWFPWFSGSLGYPVGSRHYLVLVLATQFAQGSPVLISTLLLLVLSLPLFGSTHSLLSAFWLVVICPPSWFSAFHYRLFLPVIPFRYVSSSAPFRATPQLACRQLFLALHSHCHPLRFSPFRSVSPVRSVSFPSSLATVTIARFSRHGRPSKLAQPSTSVQLSSPHHPSQHRLAQLPPASSTHRLPDSRTPNDTIAQSPASFARPDSPASSMSLAQTTHRPLSSQLGFQLHRSYSHLSLTSLFHSSHYSVPVLFLFIYFISTGVPFLHQSLTIIPPIPDQPCSVYSSPVRISFVSIGSPWQPQLSHYSSPVRILFLSLHFITTYGSCLQLVISWLLPSAPVREYPTVRLDSFSSSRPIPLGLARPQVLG